MPATEYVQCPTCGWTGSSNDLDSGGNTHHCPVCDTQVDPT